MNAWQPVPTASPKGLRRQAGYKRRDGDVSLEVVCVAGSWCWSVSRYGTRLATGEADTSSLACEAADLAWGAM